MFKVNPLAYNTSPLTIKRKNARIANACKGLIYLDTIFKLICMKTKNKYPIIAYR
jgi:hypothetical protein